MITLKIENKLIELIKGFRSKLRSFILFGNINKVKFGRKVRLSARDLTIGRDIIIGDFSDIRGGKVVLKNKVHIHENVLIRSNEIVEIGEGTTINRNSCILSKVIIGEHCSIAPNVVIIGSNHNFQNPNEFIQDQGISMKGVIIEDDVWIAANVTILDGVIIGKGSVIAAGAVVNKSVKSYEIIGGVPAKHLKKRQ